MRVDGPDVLAVERRLELPCGQRRMLSARADGRSGMLLVVDVVVFGRGWHPLLVDIRRVARGPCSLLSCLDSMRSVSTMADSIMMFGLVRIFIRRDVREGSNGAACARGSVWR